MLINSTHFKKKKKKKKDKPSLEPFGCNSMTCYHATHNLLNEATSTSLIYMTQNQPTRHSSPNTDMAVWTINWYQSSKDSRQAEAAQCPPCSSGEKWTRPVFSMGFPGASAVKNPPAMQEMRVQSLGGEDPLEKERATHSSILSGEFQGERGLTC